MKDNSLKLTVKEEVLFSRLTKVIEQKSGILLQKMQTILEPVILDDVNLLKPGLFKEFVSDEVHSFLNFLKTRNPGAAAARGELAAAKELNKAIILELPEIYRLFFTEHTPEEYHNTAWKIVNIYMMEYISLLFQTSNS